MMTVYPERIAQAREMAGLSKSELAEKLGLSPAAVSQWENGSKRPHLHHIEIISKLLGVSPQLLTTPLPDSVNRKGPVTFRALAQAKSRKLNKRAERLAEMATEVFLKLGEYVQMPSNALPDINHKVAYEIEDIERIANECRRHWGLGDKPIHKLGELLESKGILISRASFKNDKVDAFSLIIDGLPLIILGSDKQDRARSRFDVAHELGHLILHQHWTTEDLMNRAIHERIEDEANLFAGAFLLPKSSFLDDAKVLSLNQFYMLKPKWGVSVQAMIMRSKNLGLIDDDRSTKLHKAMARRSMRQAKGESFDDQIPDINISLARKSIELLESHGVVHRTQLETLMPFPKSVLESALGIRLIEDPPIEAKIINFPVHIAS